MLYKFTGAVTSHGILLASRWHGVTNAESKAKAKSNLEYQFKRLANRIPSSQITLVGEIKEVS